VIDRDYFRAIYFRSPGGVLFEVSTDEPGFTIDEPLEHLGEKLCLPRQHEHLRPRLERVLPRLQ
jgi:glyoxalase family protein